VNDHSSFEKIKKDWVFLSLDNPDLKAESRNNECDIKRLINTTALHFTRQAPAEYLLGIRSKSGLLLIY